MTDEGSGCALELLFGGLVVVLIIVLFLVVTALVPLP
jgi:hypothetical protein